MGNPTETMDHSIDAAALIEAEIETLIIRLQSQDPDAILRVEKLLSRIKMMAVVNKATEMH